VPTIAVRNLDIHYEDLGNRDGEPLILFHGGVMTGRSNFRHQYTALGELYRLLVPGLRSHGKTVTPLGPLRLSEVAEDSVSFIAALGIEKAQLLCFSLGANQLFFVAHDHPELVQTLTLIGSSPAHDEISRASIEELRTNPAPEWLPSWQAQHEPTHGAGHVQRILDLLVDSANRPGEFPFTDDDLCRIAVPTLIIHGDRDVYYPVSNALRMYNLIPNSELFIAPNTGHAVNLEKPALVNTVLLDFLGRHPMHR
jgi:pimeloyl-ACP methyl ester carboxylesterase